jgi:hypothetical protein
VEIVANGTISLVRESLQDGDDRQEPQPIGANLRQGKGLLELALASCQWCLCPTITSHEKIRGIAQTKISTECVDTEQNSHSPAHLKHATVVCRIHRQEKRHQFNAPRLSIPRN